MATLAAADQHICDQVGVAQLVTGAQQGRGWLDAFDATLAIAATRLASQGECEPTGPLLTGGGRRGVNDAEAAAKRGAVCPLLPSCARRSPTVRRLLGLDDEPPARTGDAFADSAVSADYIAEVARPRPRCSRDRRRYTTP